MCLKIFGRNSTGVRLKKIEQSENYDIEKKSFKNRKAAAFDAMIKKISLLQIVKKIITNKAQRTPKKKLLTVNHIQEFVNSKDDIAYIWLGHSTVLLKIFEKVIIFDPLFKSASPFSFIKKRFQASPISLEELPRIDFVMISHDHYDHLEMSSIVSISKRYNSTFVVPLGVGEHLSMWGICENKIVELDWGESCTIENINFYSTPSMHSSGRKIFGQNKTLWCSWVIESCDKKIFFSGDSGYDDHFKEIGNLHGPFDIAFVECGQYNTMWSLSHMHPSESIKAFTDLQGKKMQPIHWGALDLALHSWNEPIKIAHKLALEKKINLLHPMHGELVELSKESEHKIWWV